MTLQVAEKLIYKDEEFHFEPYPLETYLTEKQISFANIWSKSSCQRGYNGTWLIEDDKLFLIDLSATIIKDYGMWKWPFEYVEVGLDYLFPNQDKVFAEWFSGELDFWYGKLLGYYIKDMFNRGYPGPTPIYEKKRVITIESGKAVRYNETDYKSFIDKILV